MKAIAILVTLSLSLAAFANEEEVFEIGCTYQGESVTATEQGELEVVVKPDALKGGTIEFDENTGVVSVKVGDQSHTVECQDDDGEEDSEDDDLGDEDEQDEEDED